MLVSYPVARGQFPERVCPPRLVPSSEAYLLRQSAKSKFLTGSRQGAEVRAVCRRARSSFGGKPPAHALGHLFDWSWLPVPYISALVMRFRMSRLVRGLIVYID